MGKIYCLLGKSASGKSTIEKEMMKYGFKRIISTTTRPIREHEEQGVDYNYISEEEFNTLIKDNVLLENTTYREWHYGIDKRYNNINLETNNYICVIEPTGYKQLVNNIGKDNVVGIYIYSDDKDRLLRSLNRENNPDCYEICRRYISDIELFNGIENKVDFVIKNNNIQKSIELILDQCNIEYKKQPTIIPRNTKVRIIKINDLKKAKHLENFIGEEGVVITNHVYYKGVRRYKVLFKFGEECETAYFRDSELELL